jgi:hypothetical protein
MFVQQSQKNRAAKSNNRAAKSNNRAAKSNLVLSFVLSS